MYSDAFCKVYNEFGWNYFPEAFGEQLLQWLSQNQITVRSSMDLACGTGVLCEVLYKHGIEAAGMDFSEGMIDIARKSNPNIHYDVADMILYRPEKSFDLVTCTGDALNHIIHLSDVEKIFQNVNAYLNQGGYFILDILNENEISSSEPFYLDFSDTVKACFQMTRENEAIVRLKTSVYENGTLQFEEVITETVHDPAEICNILNRCGFEVIKCSDQLLEDGKHHSTTWYVVARKN